LKSNNLSKSVTPDRCAFTKSHGHRCRMLPLDASPYCLAHQPKPSAPAAPAQLTAAELAEAAGTLSTPAEIHRFQSKVTLLLIHGRLTTKIANAYSYQVLTLLRGCREISHHEKLQSELAEREAEKARINKVMSWSIPRPDRSGPSDPPDPASAESAANASSSESSSPEPETNLVGAGLVHTEPRTACPESSRSARPLLDVAHTETHTNTTHPTATVASPKPSESSSNPTTTESGSARRSRVLCGEGGTSSTSLTSCIPPDFYNHFHPIDPSLPRGSQDLSKSIPHPDAAECRRLEARRGLNFNRRRSQPVSRW
jgi:hypothetical protein